MSSPSPDHPDTADSEAALLLERLEEIHDDALNCLDRAGLRDFARGEDEAHSAWLEKLAAARRGLA